MVYKEDLEDFLAKTIARKALLFDLEHGFEHAHTKADPDAVRPPFKFNLCTPKVREGARLDEHDMDRLGGFIAQGILEARYQKISLAAVPNAGLDIMDRVARRLVDMGMPFTPLVLSKGQDGSMEFLNPDEYVGGPVCLVDDLLHRGVRKGQVIDLLRMGGVQVSDLWVFLDYEQGDPSYFQTQGIKVHSCSTVRKTLELGLKQGSIEALNYGAAMRYLEQTRDPAAS